MEFINIKRPYLIQRGSFRDVKDEDIVGLDSLISYDYMGSAEFEFGALPASLRRITHAWKDYHTVPIEAIKDADGQILQLLCRKGTEEEIKQALMIFASERYPSIRTKESVGLYGHIKAEHDWDLRINFWWDITGSDYVPDILNNRLGNGNDWMACFGDDIRRLVIAINKVCVKHGVAAEGPIVPDTKARPLKNLKIINDFKTIKVILGNRSSTITKKAILGFEAFPDEIKIIIKTKSGPVKTIIVKEKEGSIRTYLLNLLEECKLVNKQHKG